MRALGEGRRLSFPAAKARSCARVLGKIPGPGKRVSGRGGRWSVSLGLVIRILMAVLEKCSRLFLTQVRRAIYQQNFSTSSVCSAIQKMTRVRVVDNSTMGNTPYHRPPKCIHVYNKSGVGKVGDKILLAIKGEKRKALIVGHRMPGPRMTPRFDSNNVVLIEDNGNPIGTRIKTPIPSFLRKRQGEFSKVLAIAQNFV